MLDADPDDPAPPRASGGRLDPGHGEAADAQPTRALRATARSLQLLALLLAVLALYAAALNPYFLPETYDNIVYYFGAKALSEGAGFTFQGTPIERWPPLLN